MKFSSKNRTGNIKNNNISICSKNLFIGFIKFLSLNCLARFKENEADTKTNENDEIRIPS